MVERLGRATYGMTYPPSLLPLFLPAPTSGSLNDLPAERYTVKYTPTVSGKYYLVVTISDGEISTDMTEGVTVEPAEAWAVSSTFDSNLVSYSWWRAVRFPNRRRKRTWEYE